MPAFDFPSGPPIGTSVTTPDGAVRYWDGFKWSASYPGTSASFPDLSNDLVTAQGAITARTLAGHFADRYSVRDWGAKCDGTTNDYAAVMAAITAVLAMPHGGTISFPAGRTVIGSAIVASVPAGVTLTLEGMGQGASELYFSNDTDGLSFMMLRSGTTWGSVNLHAFSLTRGPGIAYPDLSWAKRTGIMLYADTTGVTTPIAYGTASSLRDLVVAGSTYGVNQWQNSIVLNGIGGCSFSNVVIRGLNAQADTGGAAVDLGDALLTITGPNSNQYAAGNRIVNCHLQGGSVGLLIGGAGTGYVQGVYVANTSIIGQYDSVRWPSAAGLIGEELALANVSLNASHRGVYISHANQCSIAGAAILHFNAGTISDWAGIELNQSEYNSVNGNNIVGAHTGTEFGVVCSDCGAFPNTIVGNVVTNIVSGSAFYMKGTTTGSTVVGNSSTSLTAAPVAQDIALNTVLANTMAGVALAYATDLPVVYTTSGKARWYVGDDGAEGTAYNTTASTTSGSILTFAATTLGSVLVNDVVSGTNIQPGTTVSLVNNVAGTVTLSVSVTGTVASGAAITFHTPNTGSDFEILARNDDGSQRSTPFHISRSTGLTAFGGAVSFNSTVGFNSTAPIAKPTGWGTSTGGARAAITASSTLPQVAAGLAQLLNDLTAYGMIGV